MRTNGDFGIVGFAGVDGNGDVAVLSAGGAVGQRDGGRSDARMVGLGPGAEALPCRFLVGLREDCLDVHVFRFRHFAKLGKAVAVVAISGLGVGVDGDSLCVVGAGLGAIPRFEERIACIECREIKLGILGESFLIESQRSLHVASAEEFFGSGKIGLRRGRRLRRHNTRSIAFPHLFQQSDEKRTVISVGLRIQK